MVKHKNSGKTGREQCEIGDKIGQKTVIAKRMACGGKESPFLNAIKKDIATWTGSSGYKH